MGDGSDEQTHRPDGKCTDPDEIPDFAEPLAKAPLSADQPPNQTHDRGQPDDVEKNGFAP